MPAGTAALLDESSAPKLGAMLENVLRLAYSGRTPDDLHHTQFLAIRHLLDASGPIPVSALSKHLGVTSGAASRVVASLERRGLLFVCRSEHDRRKVLVQLSSSGRLASKDDPIHAVNGALDSLTEGERLALRQSLKAVCNRLRAAC